MKVFEANITNSVITFFENSKGQSIEILLFSLKILLQKIFY